MRGNDQASGDSTSLPVVQETIKAMTSLYNADNPRIDTVKSSVEAFSNKYESLRQEGDPSFEVALLRETMDQMYTASAQNKPKEVKDLFEFAGEIKSLIPKDKLNEMEATLGSTEIGLLNDKNIDRSNVVSAVSKAVNPPPNDAPPLPPQSVAQQANAQSSSGQQSSNAQQQNQSRVNSQGQTPPPVPSRANRPPLSTSAQQPSVIPATTTPAVATTATAQSTTQTAPAANTATPAAATPGTSAITPAASALPGATATPTNKKMEDDLKESKDSLAEIKNEMKRKKDKSSFSMPGAKMMGGVVLAALIFGGPVGIGIAFAAVLMTLVGSVVATAYNASQKSSSLKDLGKKLEDVGTKIQSLEKAIASPQPQVGQPTPGQAAQQGQGQAAQQQPNVQAAPATPTPPRPANPAPQTPPRPVNPAPQTPPRPANPAPQIPPKTANPVPQTGNQSVSQTNQGAQTPPAPTTPPPALNMPKSYPIGSPEANASAIRGNNPPPNDLPPPLPSTTLPPRTTPPSDLPSSEKIQNSNNKASRHFTMDDLLDINKPSVEKLIKKRDSMSGPVLPNTKEQDDAASQIPLTLPSTNLSPPSRPTTTLPSTGEEAKDIAKNVSSADLEAAKKAAEQMGKAGTQLKGSTNLPTGPDTAVSAKKVDNVQQR